MIMEVVDINTVVSQLDLVANGIDALDEAVSDFVKGTQSEMDIPDVAEILLDLDDQKRNLSAVYDRVASLVSDLIGDAESIRTSSGTLIEKNWSKARKAWQHDALRRATVSKVMNLATDFDTGERLLTTEQIVDTVMGAGHIDYWRLKQLKDLGIDPDSYCDAGESTSHISIRRDL